MEIDDLVGEHVLTAVGELSEKWDDDDWEHSSVFLFTLDGQTYAAIEDPSDGYRSCLRELVKTDRKPHTELPPERVVGRIRTKGEWANDEVLELISISTGKTVVEVGTTNHDDYYPSFQAYFDPLALSSNTTETSENGSDDERM